MIEALISIKPRHVENILSGKKTVELRLKSMSLPVGSRLWIYATLPVGKVTVTTEIDFVESLSPEEAWTQYGGRICISRKEFDLYTRERVKVSVIGLRNTKKLEKQVCLASMRRYEVGFQPPQFFTKLSPGRALYAALHAHSSNVAVGI